MCLASIEYCTYEGQREQYLDVECLQECEEKAGVMFSLGLLMC